MQSKQAAFNYSTTAGNPGASYFNTFNPLSQLFGAVDRVPENLAKWIPVGDADTRYMIFKLGGIGLLSAAVVGGIRLAQHVGKVNDVRRADAPGAELKSKLNSSFELENDAQSEEEATIKPQKKTAGMADGFVGTALPVSVALLSAALAYKGADAWADTRKGEVLNDRIKGKNKHLKDLIIARARNASGALSTNEASNVLVRPDYEENGEALAKTAGLWDSIGGAAGIVAAVIIAGTGIGSYMYFSANNPNNIRYNAYKKGLEEYAAQRSLMNPLTIGTADSNMFAQIDKKKNQAKKKEQVKQLENNSTAVDALLNDKHTPVSITI